MMRGARGDGQRLEEWEPDKTVGDNGKCIRKNNEMVNLIVVPTVVCVFFIFLLLFSK